MSVLALGAGVGICVSALVDPGEINEINEISERRHTRRELWRLGLVVALALALALRKPGEDLALLHGAGALLIAATVLDRPRGRATSLGVGLACALGAALPLLEAARAGATPGPVVLVSLVLAALACVGLSLGWGAGPPERPAQAEFS
jgi:VIT1/CCC1 family predicted Fe2+/Mn2+ transporter